MGNDIIKDWPECRNFVLQQNWGFTFVFIWHQKKKQRKNQKPFHCKKSHTHKVEIDAGLPVT